MFNIVGILVFSSHLRYYFTLQWCFFMLMLIKTAVTFTVITAVGGKVKSPTRSEKSAWLCLQKLSQFFFLFVTKKNPEAPQTLKISSSSSCFLNQALDLQWKHSEMLWLMKWIWENIYIRKQCITLGLFAKSICSRFVPSETWQRKYDLI